MILWGSIGGFSGIFPFSAFDIQKAKAATFSMQSGYYIGTGASKSISGLGFTPALVMIKAEDVSGVGMVVKSSAMPANESQFYAAASADDTNTLITLGSDGFTVSSGANINTSGVRWDWVAFGGSDCTASGTFCVGTYSGTGSAQSVNTGFTPDLVATKDASTNAAIWKSSSMSANENNFFKVSASNTGGQEIKTLDSSGFTVGTSATGSSNASSHTYYFYAFKEVSGVMDVGKYTGSGVARNITSSNDAGLTFQGDFMFLKDSSDAATGALTSFDRGSFSGYFTDTAFVGNQIKGLISSGGFKLGTGTANTSAHVDYYAIFGGAADPSSSGTFKYTSGTYTGTGSSLSVTSLGFTPNLVIVKGAGAQYAFFRTSNVPGDKSFLLGTNVAGAAGYITSMDSDGFSIGTNANANTNAVTYYWEAFGNAWNPDTNSGAKDFTIGAYTGSGFDSRDIFRLPLSPDLIVIKDSPSLSLPMWRTSAMSGDLSNEFIGNAAAAADVIQSVGDHTFQLGVASQPHEVNTSADLCYWFAFASSTYFAVGSYTGTGSGHDITSIGNDPDLVWVKKRTGGTVRNGMFLANNLNDATSQYFTNTANAASKITALGTNLFTVSTGSEVNENTFTYDYASWESPPTTTPAISVTDSGGTTSITEGGATDTYTLSLNYRPSASVAVSISADAQSTVSTSSIVFTTSNWSTPQTITVTAVNDSVAEGAHTSTITHTATSTDATYNNISISNETAHITDNDTAGFTVSAISGNTTEAGGTATFTVVLTSQPTGTVTTTVHSSNTAEGTINTSTLVFSTSDWNVARTVTVTGVDDSVDDGDVVYSIILDTATSTDTNYNGNPADVSVTNTDNDTAGVTVTESGGTTNITEGGATDSYTIVLNSQPTASVFVSISPDAQSTVSTGSIKFTTANWSTPQTITVTAVNDSVAEGGHTSTITHSATSTDGTYNTIPISSVVAAVTDNDSAGFTVSAISGNTTEAGGTATFTVVLTSQPTGTVTTTVHSSNTAEGTLTTSTLVFNAASWNLARTVTVTGVDDSVDDGDVAYSIILDIATSTDPNYDGVNPANVAVTNTDNDTAGFTVSAISGNTTEAGGTATFTVVLNSQPTGTVTTTVHSSDTTEGTITTSTLVFTAASWNLARTVTVTGVDDALADGNIDYSIILDTATSTGDANYAGVNPSDVAVTNTDNDTVGVTVVESGDSTDIEEGGGTDSYTIVLNTQPTASVFVRITPDDQSTVSTGSIKFTTANWSTPQTITVTAVDDALVEGPHTSTITHIATSTDLGYDGIAIADVTANITDNDIDGGGGIPGFDVSAIDGDTTEGGGSASFTVVLTDAPLGVVTTTVHSSDTSEGTPDTTELTFDPGNWNVPQTVTVTGVDDSVADGDIGYSIILDAASSPDDPAYDGMDPDNVIVTNIDDDVVGVTLTETDASTDVTEGGIDDSYDIVLNSQPTANVTITITPDDQVDVSTSSITINPSNWDVPRTITVTAVDDNVDEGLQFSTITNVAASADPDYNGIFIDSVFPTITDNDHADVILTGEDVLEVTEGGATSDYTIELGSQPTANVVISLTPDPQVSLSTSSITINPSNWDVPRTITVTAVDDSVAEDLTFGTITTEVASGDGNYNFFAVGDLFPTVHDNDNPGITQVQSDGATAVTEGGGPDTYTVVLDTEPTSQVTIDLTNDAQITLSSTSLYFDNTNWNIPQTVTVTPVDDHISEAPVISSITYNVFSDDLFYNGFGLGGIDVDVADNDDPGVTLVQSGDSTDIAEGGATDSYTIVLNSQPTDDVTIAITPDAYATVSTSSIVFNPENWNVERTITVTAIDDAIAEGDHIATMSNDATSADPDYNGAFIPLVLANITDNDTAGVVITESGDSTDITEGGATDSYTVVLNSEPTDDVSVSITPDDQSTVSSSSIVFNPENWDTPRTVTVTAVDDAITEGDHTSTITHTVTSTDIGYDAIAVADVVANITDNETSGFDISPISGDTSEDGTTATFTVVLLSEPTGIVTTTIHSEDTTEQTLDTSTLVFSPADWNIPRTVTVTGVDDDIDDGNQPNTIIFDTATSTDPAYDGVNPSDLDLLVNLDNDTAGVTVTESGGTTDITEGGATDTYTIVLDTQPTGNVFVEINSDAQSTVSTSSIFFTTANWNVAKTVTVTAVNDAVIEGDHTSTITHVATSTDGGYDGIAIADVVANVTDNDASGFTLSAISGDTTEAGGTATFTVVLTSEPTNIVTTTVSSLDTTEGTVNTSTLVFSPADWNFARTITVTGVDDNVDDGDVGYSVALGLAESLDLNYDGLMPGFVSVTTTDNDTAGVTVTQSGGTTDITEGGVTDSYTLVLNSQPTGNVFVEINPDAQSTVSTSSIFFTSANWNVAQTVTVTAVDDAAQEGDHTSTLSHVVTSTDPGYDAIVVDDVVANVTDNDSAGFSVSAISGNTTEAGGSATFTVVLNTAPAGIVTTTVHSSDTTEGTVNTTTLVFSPADWNLARTVTVTGVNDTLDDGDIVYSIILDTATSTDDGDYDGVNPNDVNVTNTDNDTAGVTVTESGGTTDITEGGASDSYTIVLNSQPTGDVSIHITPDAQSTVSTSSLVFNPANWNTARTVTVTAVDDAAAEGDHTSTITHVATSTDGGYDAIAIADVVANVTDNDNAGFDVSAISGNTTEAGGSATFTVVLISPPTGIVTTTVHSSDITEGTVNTTTLVFSPADWNLARTVTVTGVNDALDDGDIAYSIILDTATSTEDVNYIGLNPDDVNVTNTDNDTVGVTLTESGGHTNVTEGGATDSYTIVLNSEPTGNVAVHIASDAQSTVSTSSILFTTTTWNVARTITVVAVNDNLAEGGHTSTITQSVTSTDGAYDGLGIPDVVATITDNDTAGVTLTQSGGTTTITEGGATDSYTLVLTSQPSSSVHITITPDAQSTVSTSSIIFTTTTWNIVQTITVTAVDDVLAEGDHTSTITNVAASADANYDAIGIADVTANITDNDTNGVVLTESGGHTNITEGGATDSYTLVLGAEPGGTVNIVIAPDDQSTVSTSSINFTPANWNVAQTITVTAINDVIAEGPHTSTITHTVSSTDDGYDGIAVDDVVANITDNDIAGVTLTQSGGTTNIAEGGATDSYTIVLNSEPASDVTISITPDGQSDVSTTSIVFSTSSWHIAQTITVTAIDDIDVEGPHTSTITHSADSLDAAYNDIAIADLTANVIDNDTPGVTVIESDGTTDITEGGATDSYTIVLNALPANDVTIDVTPDAHSTVSTSSLVFNVANWNIARTVTVTAVDDDISQGPHISTISHTVSSDDLNYNEIATSDVVANVTDNDSAGFTVSVISGNTSEDAATSSYTIVLNSEPTDDVVVPITSSNPNEGTANVLSVTFTSVNWDTPQTVIVTGVDDSIDDGDTVYSIVNAAAVSEDANYNGRNPDDVNVTNTDNDTAGISVTQSGGTTNVTEGGATDSYTLVLDTQPTNDVTITITPDANTTVSTSSIVFTSANWNNPQTITVIAVNNSLVDGPHDSTISATAASIDGNYDGIDIDDVTAHVTDNDVAGFTVSEISGPTSEAGGAATFTVVLNSEPAGPVTTTVSSSDLTEGTVNTTTVVFAPTDWNIPRTITVTGVDDPFDDGDIVYSVVLGAAVSGDGNYNGLNPDDVNVTNTDNDGVGVNIVQSGGSTDISEAGTTDSYTVSLGSQPASDVVVSVTPDTQSTVSTSSITFTVDNWNIPVEVTVTAVDDTVNEGNHDSTITHAVVSLDGTYNGILVENVSAHIIDNDTAQAGGGGVSTVPTVPLIPVLNNTGSSDVVVIFNQTKDTESVVFPSVTHRVIRVSFSADEAVLVIESEPIVVHLKKEVPQILDTDKNGISDLQVVYNGLVGKNPKFTFNQLQELQAVTINNGAHQTFSRMVHLQFNVVSAAFIALSNNPDFSDATFQTFTTSAVWGLSFGDGPKTVYVRFRSKSGGNFDTNVSINLVHSMIQCSLSLGHAYKSADSSAVYYITPPYSKDGQPLDGPCTKRAFKSSSIFFTYFGAWSDVQVVPKTDLEAITLDELGFMPRGPRYAPQNGTLMKVVSDPNVYLIVNHEKRVIVSEKIFKSLGFQWNQVEDVDPVLLDSFPFGVQIDQGQAPAYSVIKYADSPRLYSVEPDFTDASILSKRYIASESAWKNLNYRTDRVITLPDSTTYPDGLQIGEGESTPQLGVDTTLHTLSFTRSLALDDTGAEVEALQRILAAQGFFNHEVTGLYGPLTAEAVKSFQRAHGLEPLGIVGPGTRKVLNTL